MLDIWRLLRFIIVTVGIFAYFPGSASASNYKVLVVMSYGESFPWCISIKEGVESILGEMCDIVYYYMDTKENLSGGPGKAKEAYRHFLKFKPDGVIASDDNAQAMFVQRYLRGKVKTPVMFCGVNGEPETYGYPASNVSGVLERIPFEESITFAQQLVPSIRTFGLIIKESPTGDRILEQINRNSHKYPAAFRAYRMPRTIDEAVSMTQELKKDCDLLMVAALQGITGKEGSPVPEKEAVSLVVKTFGKPTVSTEEYNVRNGTLCSVARTGVEQGKKAAEMLLAAMRGTPISDIPITQNQYGKRILNVTVMKKFNIKPEPSLLFGAKLVRTE